jgi:hypothetical protein
MRLLQRLDSLVQVANDTVAQGKLPRKILPVDPGAKTAIVMVNSYNGLGLHTLFNVIRFFGKEFRNFVFVQIGVIDAGNFKGVREIDSLKLQTTSDVQKYVHLVQAQGYAAQGMTYFGIDVVEQVDKIISEVSERFPHAVFFGGQLVFTQETFLTRWLHNFTVFTMQKKFYSRGLPFVILPIRV